MSSNTPVHRFNLNLSIHLNLGGNVLLGPSMFRLVVLQTEAFQNRDVYFLKNQSSPLKIIILTENMYNAGFGLTRIKMDKKTCIWLSNPPPIM